jgi:hypothetical protein
MFYLIEPFDVALDLIKQRNWDCIYVAVDVHGTILKPNYSSDEIPTEFYKNAIQTLSLMTRIKQIKLIMYTSSTPEDCVKYDLLFQLHNIKFDFINENPDIISSGYGDFSKKPYFNVLLDDKAGFKANTKGFKNDWWLLKDFLLTRIDMFTNKINNEINIA